MKMFPLFSREARALWQGIRIVLADRAFLALSVALWLVFLAAYLFVPVWLTPGNTLSFQLQLLRWQDYAFIGILAAAASLLTVMQLFLFLRHRRWHMRTAAEGGLGVVSALLGGLLATAACSSCVLSLLGFLGAGSAFFLLQHQSFVVWVATLLVVGGLWGSARKVAGVCRDCLVG